MAIELNGEPISFDEVVAQARADTVTAAEEQDLIELVIIPAARQVAETKTGSAITPRKFTLRIAQPPVGSILLPMGNAYAIDKVTCAGSDVDPMTYSLRQAGAQSWLDIAAWPTKGEAVVEYLAGVDITLYPSVKQWLLLCAAFMFDHRDLMTVGQAPQAMPQNYVDSLLMPITVPPRI